MKTILWILIGIFIGMASWIPLGFTTRYDIPFFATVIAFGGTLAGAIIVIIAGATWIRYGNAPPRSDQQSP